MITTLKREHVDPFDDGDGYGRADGNGDGGTYGHDNGTGRGDGHNYSHGDGDGTGDGFSYGDGSGDNYETKSAAFPDYLRTCTDLMTALALL